MGKCKINAAFLDKSFCCHNDYFLVLFCPNTYIIKIGSKYGCHNKTFIALFCQNPSSIKKLRANKGFSPCGPKSTKRVFHGGATYRKLQSRSVHSMNLNE